jgi:hypothetical protein
MATVKITGGKNVQETLKRIAALIEKGKGVNVGFLEDATYPDGTKVAMVAAIQNFGAPGRSIPARPFFTNMVSNKAPTWGAAFAKLLKANNYDTHAALAMMGEGIKGQLQQAIKDTNEPPLSQITLMLRKMRSEDQSLEVTGAVVGEAARRVAAGESTAGVSTKPLNDTAHMQNSVDYEVIG